MKRTPLQQVSLAAAVVLGLAPLGFAIVRTVSANGDTRLVWMAGVSSLFAASVLAAAIGRRRTRQAVRVQAAVIFVVSTLLAMGIALLGSPEAVQQLLATATAFGGSLAIASALVTAARPDHA